MILYGEVPEEEIAFLSYNSWRRKKRLLLISFIIVVATIILAGCTVAIILGVVYSDRNDSNSGTNISTLHLRLLHFNDMYLINGYTSDSQTCGGVARAATIRKQSLQEFPTTSAFIFSGDCYFPSALSSVFKSAPHIVETFNLLNITIATIGNHEFDMGYDYATSEFPNSTFPWIAANMFIANTTDMLPGVLPAQIIKFGDHDEISILFVGFVTDYTKLSNVTTNEITYADFVPIAKQVIAEYKKTETVHLVVGVTHLLMDPEDRILMNSVDEIDFILGGHDHEWMLEYFQDKSTHRNFNRFVLKSSQDLQKIGIVDIIFKKEEKWQVENITLGNITLNEEIELDPEMQAVVEKYNRILDEMAQKQICQTNVTLLSTNLQIRTQESNLGNYIADAVNLWCQHLVSDRLPTNTTYLAVVNGGGIRSSKEFPAGFNLTQLDVLEMLPFSNIMMVISINGSVLKDVLEHSVSNVAGVAGQFLQISGFKFEYNDSAPVGGKVLNIKVLGSDIPILENDFVVLCLPDFLVGGGDGYGVLVGSEAVLPSNAGQLLLDIVLDKMGLDKVISPTVEGRIVKID